MKIHDKVEFDLGLTRMKGVVVDDPDKTVRVAFKGKDGKTAIIKRHIVKHRVEKTGEKHPFPPMKDLL